MSEQRDVTALPLTKPGWAKRELDRIAAQVAQLPAWLLPKGAK